MIQHQDTQIIKLNAMMLNSRRDKFKVFKFTEIKFYFCWIVNHFLSLGGLKNWQIPFIEINKVL